MTTSARYGRDAAIEALLSAAARLRWAIGSARQLILALGEAAGADRLADQVDRLANRAQRWLVTEPPQPLREIGGLVGRVTRRGRRGPGLAADHAALVDLDLDGLDLARISLCGANLTEVTLRGADCSAADASSSRWLRCRLEHGSLRMAVLAGATLERCDLSRARLDGTSWHRAVLAGCTLHGATLTDARLDRAELTDCDLRGANLAIVRSPHVATLAGARFVRCDLRDTHWGGRELGGASFIDCKLFGARGAPALAGVSIERPDLSRLGDGSQIATQSDVIAAW
ncbi:MAG: pentapeptide repeat-containing protein [Deltaproteobacteria bacterium]|nr:MAG: pentapeptide repeat-containing protein [Deltaproteobacteria bacterium]